MNIFEHFKGPEYTVQIDKTGEGSLGLSLVGKTGHDGKTGILLRYFARF